MRTYFLGGLVGFMVGILGNIVAAWVQQDVLRDVFTRERLVFILILTVCGLVISSLIEARAASPISRGRTSSPHTNNLSSLRLWWSRIFMRGKGTHLNDIKSVGSDIDIDTR